MADFVAIDIEPGVLLLLRPEPGVLHLVFADVIAVDIEHRLLTIIIVLLKIEMLLLLTLDFHLSSSWC